MGSLKVRDNNLPTDMEGKGDIIVGTSQVEIAITGAPIMHIRIQADESNTGIIFLGKTGVLSDKTNDWGRLEAGAEAFINFRDSENAWFAISDMAAQTINVGSLL